MSYFTNWFCVSDDIFTALQTGKIEDSTVEVMANAVPENALADYGLEPSLTPLEGIKAFFACLQSGKKPEAHGAEMTALVASAIHALGTQHGDFSEGSSVVRDQWQEVYSRVPLLEGMRAIAEGELGYSEGGFPYLSLIPSEKVIDISEGLKNLDEAAREVLEEEYDGLSEIVASAKEDGRNVVTISG